MHRAFCKKILHFQLTIKKVTTFSRIVLKLELKFFLTKCFEYQNKNKMIISCFLFNILTWKSITYNKASQDHSNC